MSDDAVSAPAVVAGDLELAKPPRKDTRFVKGDPRINRKGRVVNSKNLVGDKFVKDLLKWYARDGMKAIDRVAKEQPLELLKFIAGMVPKKVDVEHEHTGSITFAPVSIQEVERRTRELLARIIDGDATDVSAG